jgi:hypothetical protein
VDEGGVRIIFQFFIIRKLLHIAWDFISLVVIASYLGWGNVAVAT